MVDVKFDKNNWDIEEDDPNINLKNYIGKNTVRLNELIGRKVKLKEQSKHYNSCENLDSLTDKRLDGEIIGIVKRFNNNVIDTDSYYLTIMWGIDYYVNTYRFTDIELI